MSTPTPSFSSPVKANGPPAETRTATQAEKDARNLRLVSDVSSDVFLETYLSGCSSNIPAVWPPDQKDLVQEIQNVGSGKETSLYDGSAPLLRLLNSISKCVFNSLSNPDAAALLFGSSNKRQLKDSYSTQRRFPDVVATWQLSSVLDQPLGEYRRTYSGDVLTSLVASDDRDPRLDPPTSWSSLAAVGEVKVEADGRYQLANYVRKLLQSHPELNAVLGFTVRAEGYELIYHDASVIHRSATFSWTPGPLYAFIRRLYNRPFRDDSMATLRVNDESPAWATKIGEEVFVSEHARSEPGPGQRRFMAIMIHAVTGFLLFIKDIWRDAHRRYFEGLLYEKAHEGQSMAGLMLVEHHGFVLDGGGKKIRTTNIEPRPSGKAVAARYKMRIATQDIGMALEEIHSLRQFLCMMYDACVVQRNLYQKCRILHQDISDRNIMVAPDTQKYQERCAAGYAEVKFVNQVLAKDKCAKPNPACLLIDLGNGADLSAVQGDQEALAERTGMPKFIARSVSCGKLLNLDDYNSDRAHMPKLEGSLLDLGQFMYSMEYPTLRDEIDNGIRSGTQPKVTFRHQLFHDAESTFWVIARVLARSARQGYQSETQWTRECETFTIAMTEHYPMGPKPDGRFGTSTSEDDWKAILHSDLAGLASMLSHMHKYVRPEWAFRPDLDPEHVHEALMRLLLAEIVRVDESGKDIPLAVGIRSMPGQPTSRAPSR
ncbi:hypothetical protein FS749_001211 [Ceratobasidium sp. UAMH 11750]|nr:hypothetical protein FS749_001211 [Ceratobasidium sp. UAMH 11750]